MSKFKRDNRKHVPELIVAGANSALQTAGALVGAGVSLNINNGQLGLLSWDPSTASSEPIGDFMQAGDAATVEHVKLIQGTPNSSNITKVRPWETRDPGYVASDIISKRNIRSFSADLYKPARLGAHAFSSLGTPQDEQLYKGYVFLNSVRMDRDWADNDNVIAATFTTPNYTVLGTVDPLDHMLQNLAYRFNSASKLGNSGNPTNRIGNRDFVVFAVNTGAGSGTVIGDIECGDVIEFMVSSGNIYGNPTAPVTSSIVADAPLMRALAEVINNNADIASTSTIEVINLSTAGAAANVDALIFVSLEEEKAEIFDDIAQVIPNIEVGLSDSFRDDATYLQTKINPEESVGEGWKMKIFEDNQARIYRHTMQNQPFMEFINQGFTYVDPTKNYNVYTLDYFDYEETLTTREHAPKQLTILLPVADAICTSGDDVNDVTSYTASDYFVSTGLSNTTATSIEAVFAAWLKDSNTKSPFTLHGAATTATYFNQ
jgi:hypothetical protein